MEQFLLPLLGGILIGLAVSVMLFLNGRVAGVSGIVNGALKPVAGDWGWRIGFIGGLVVGGILLETFFPGAIIDETNRHLASTIFAGLLVGFGTVMGSGCTSGHGICGLSRLSVRSIVATLLFIVFGIASATMFRIFIGGSV